MRVHDFTHYQWPDDPEAPATPELGCQLEEIAECWHRVILDEVKRNPLFRAYLATIMSLCEGQGMQ